MAYLQEAEIWDAGIYQVEIADKVIGGPDGIVNRATRALANRTAYLKNRVAALDASALTQQNDIAALLQMLTDHEGAADPHSQYALKTWVTAQIAGVIASAPGALDTLNELAAALGNDANFAATMTNALALKAPLASPTFTGTPAVPTAAADTSTTQAASTAFVIGQASSANPVAPGTAAPGTSKKYSRDDHVHPTDSTRAPLDSPTFTGLALVKGDGVGYATGAGGTVTQATSKSTGVTLNKACGQITMNNASLAADSAVSFVLTNSKIAATDVVRVCVQSGATLLAYLAQVDAVAAGSCTISLRNLSARALGEAVVLNFAIIKGVSA